VLRDDILERISNEWDKLRLARNEDGDDENPRKSLKERRALSLYNLSSKDYSEVKDNKVSLWINDLRPDAEFNIPAYVDCFISENLVRKHIEEKKIQLSKVANEEVEKRKKNEEQHKNKGNISIDLRKAPNDTHYLSLDYLANLVDKRDPIKEACLSRDANEYKPIRDALMHTSLLTKEAKQKLSSVYENIKSRIRKLLGT